MQIKSNRAQLMLAVILIAAAGLRLYGLDWDEGHHAHPDERWISMVVPTITWPRQVRDLLDPRRSTLNPLWKPDGSGGGEVRNFAYGHLPLYMQSLAGHGLASVGRSLYRWGSRLQDDRLSAFGRELQRYGEYGGINIVGRALSALSDLGTVCLIYLLGKRIHGRGVALLGAGLVAVAVTHIQLAHFSTFDVLTTFFIALSVYGSVCVIQSGKESSWPTLWAGAAAGLAVSSKFSAMPLVPVLVVAQVLRSARHSPVEERYAVARLIVRSLPDVVISLLAATTAFLLTSPFALFDLELYLKQISEQSTMVRGTADWPFTRQYYHTTPFVYQVVQQVRWGLGWPLGIAVFAGFGWTLIRQFRRPRSEELVLLGWTVPYFLLTGSFMVKFMRYMLPLLPFFILMGAALLWRLTEWSTRWIARDQGGDRWDASRWLAYGLRALGQAIPYLVLAATAVYALAFMRVYAQTHPWIQASRWIYDHVPDGSAIAREHWDDDLPIALPGERANPGEHRYNMSQRLKLPMYEPDNPAKLGEIRRILVEADYVVLATNRLYRTIPRLPERYPISSEFYRLFFDEQLGYVREAEFTAYPGLLGLQIVDDAADESFTVYDHPKPILYRKERDLSDAEWNALFGPALAKQPVWQLAKPFKLSALLDPKPALEFQEREIPPDKTLLLDRSVGELPVVADFGWNHWASGSTVGAIVVWWVVVTALGWVAWPVTFTIFSGLRDRGYLLSRSVALLIIGYLVWLPSSLRWLQNGLPLAYGALGVLGLVSALLLWRNRGEMALFLQRRRGLVLLSEAVFGLAYLAFVGVRILNPDLWEPWLGGEKSMDIAYLNACLKSAYWPPYDPYFAHGYLNYYYYGQFLMSILTRVTGIEATVAFNLIVPLLFALTVSNAFAIGYTLAGRSQRGTGRVQCGIGYGLLAVLCVTILGNLASATQLIERLGEIGRRGSARPFASLIPGLESLVHAASGVWQVVVHGVSFPGFNYWDPSRVVGYTINEFPYWSFLFADLHPHMINIPFTLFVVALALNWLGRGRPRRARLPAVPRQVWGSNGALRLVNSTPRTDVELAWSSALNLVRRIDWGAIANWVLWPVALGALAPINTWDYPAYAGLCGLVLLFTWVRDRGKQGILPGLLAAGTLTGGSLLLYWPFFQKYSPIYVGLGWSLARTHTRLDEFLTVWGLFLFLSATWLLILLAKRRSRWAIARMMRLILRYPTQLPRLDELYALLVRHSQRGYRRSIWAVLSVMVMLVWFAWRGYWVLVLMIPLLLLAALLMVQAKLSDGRRFMLGLSFTAFLLLVGVEFFYLEDHLAGDQLGWWRMNTLFKFYLQVWVMLGVAVGAAIPEIWHAISAWRPGWRGLWTTVFALLLLAAALYPVLGTPARVADRFPGRRPPIGTLDGMAFMRVGTYTWPDESSPIELWGDYDAIRWLRDHVEGTPVVAEAPIGYYREFGVRVASYTGLPTLKGMHEEEQRYGTQVGQRSARARELFITADLQRTMDLIRELEVEYVYLGPLERVEYPQADEKFSHLAARQFLEIAYQNELVTIYQVMGTTGAM